VCKYAEKPPNKWGNIIYNYIHLTARSNAVRLKSEAEQVGENALGHDFRPQIAT
jgi:hypothetical protein